MTAPFKHQTEAFERFKDKQFGALFLEQGLGKSKVAIDIAEHKFNAGITGILVICPKSLIGNWAQIEIPKHATWGNTTIIPWIPGNKKEYEFPKTFFPQWFVCNIDAVITEKWVKAFRDFFKAHPKFMLILDESTTCKSPNSQRTKRMLQVADYATSRFILSGAPITNSPLDMWAQAEILLPGLMGRNFFLFRHRYAKMVRVSLGGRSFNKIVGYQNLEELSEKINKFAAIAKKKDCLDLPPKIYRQVPVEFTPEQKERYREMKNNALTTIDDTTVHAVNAVSLINSLLQICAGQIKTGEGSDENDYFYLPTNRIDLLSDLIEESTEKALIWCSFVGAANMIENVLGNRLYRIRAETKEDDRQTILSQFASSEEKLGLLCNQASMGRGHTILEGRNMIYYAQRFSVEQRVQSEDRPDRIGQTKSILISELYTPKTVEEKVIKVLRTNRELADKIIVDRKLLRELIAND